MDNNAGNAIHITLVDSPTFRPAPVTPGTGWIDIGSGLIHCDTPEIARALAAAAISLAKHIEHHRPEDTP